MESGTHSVVVRVELLSISWSLGSGAVSTTPSVKQAAS